MKYPADVVILAVLIFNIFLPHFYLALIGILKYYRAICNQLTVAIPDTIDFEIAWLYSRNS